MKQNSTRTACLARTGRTEIASLDGRKNHGRVFAGVSEVLFVVNQ
jgi:hypothetical protein